MNSAELPDWVTLSMPQTNQIAKRWKSSDINSVEYNDDTMMQKLSIATADSIMSISSLPTSNLFGHRNEDMYTSLTRILSVGNEKELNQYQMHWMHDQVRQILTANTSSSPTRSFLNCTALHLAIRNYGSFQPLLHTLLEFDKKVGYPLLTKRDDTGDLPLHTACRMGIPCENIRLLLSHMASMTPNPSKVIWTTNNRGWTPIDLAWMRHLESSSHEVISTLQSLDGPYGEAEKRISQLLGNLLSETVDHILESENPRAAIEGVSPLIKVVSFLIHACYTHEKDNQNDAEQFLIHRVFRMLQGSDSPPFPLPLLKLLLVQYPHHASAVDDHGKLPLHYALSFPANKTQHTRGIPQSDWRLYVREILVKNPSACSVKDSVGRLPLHYCLQNETNDKESYDSIVRDIVLECPASVGIEDPITSLYPFLMAAFNPNISLDTVYWMMRLHPQCLAL